MEPSKNETDAINQQRLFSNVRTLPNGSNILGLIEAVSKTLVSADLKIFDKYDVYGRDCRHRYLKHFKMTKAQFHKEHFVTKMWFHYGKPRSKKQILYRIRMFCESLKNLTSWMTNISHHEICNKCDIIYTNACNIKKRKLSVYLSKVESLFDTIMTMDTKRKWGLTDKEIACKDCEYFTDRELLDKFERMMSDAVLDSHGHIGDCHRQPLDVAANPTHNCHVEKAWCSYFQTLDLKNYENKEEAL